MSSDILSELVRRVKRDGMVPFELTDNPDELGRMLKLQKDGYIFYVYAGTERQYAMSPDFVADRLIDSLGTELPKCFGEMGECISVGPMSKTMH